MRYVHMHSHLSAPHSVVFPPVVCFSVSDESCVWLLILWNLLQRYSWDHKHRSPYCKKKKRKRVIAAGKQMHICQPSGKVTQNTMRPLYWDKEVILLQEKHCFPVFFSANEAANCTSFLVCCSSFSTSQGVLEITFYIQQAYSHSVHHIQCTWG